MDIEPVETSLWNKLQKHEKWATVMISLEGILTLLLLANIIYLNFYLFTHQTPPPASSPQKNPPSPPSPTPCGNCSITPPLSPTIVSTQQSVVHILQDPVKDYYVSLGNGTTQTSDWENVPGVQAVIDFGQYQNIKEIHFEGSLYVPTANEWVEIRLYNETDKHPVWFSDMTMSANATAYLTSPPLSYDTGSKLYQVQMKTQLQAPATLVQARVHIILR